MFLAFFSRRCVSGGGPLSRSPPVSEALGGGDGRSSPALGEQDLGGWAGSLLVVVDEWDAGTRVTALLLQREGFDGAQVGNQPAVPYM